MGHTGAYGTGPYGSGYWGGGSVLSFEEFGKAYATGDRIVRIELVTEPLHSTTTGAGDALNPRTWQITDPTSGKSWTSLAVREVSSKIFEILTLEVLPKHFTSLSLGTITLKSVSGVPFPTLAFPFNGNFLAINNTDESRTAARGYLPKDLANVQVAPATTGAAADMVGGTLQIESSGDYATMYGEALVRKLILRRLVSKKGDFFHLPDYGLGLREKEPLPTSDLRKLAAAIEQDVALEPEVEAVKANLSYSAAASALIVQMKVRLKPTGQQAQIALTVPTGTVQF